MRRNKINKKIEFSLKGVRIYVLGGVCGLLAILSIFMTIETATSGAEIADLQKKEALLVSQQQNTKANLVESLSANSLQEKSLEMGFVEVNNLVYVSGGIPVARLP